MSNAISYEFWGGGNIHKYSPPSSGTAIATSMFKETIQEIYTIHDLKNRQFTTLKNNTITNDGRSLIPTFKST